MTRKIDAFGGNGPHGIRYEGDTDNLTVWFTSDLWFDRDLDGKWIVWSQQRHPGSRDGDDDTRENMGSIIVTDPRVVTFIELLSQLLVDPARFSDELRFDTTTANARSRTS